MAEDMTWKRCTKCGESKSLSEFRRQRDRLDGHKSHCKMCSRKGDQRYREGGHAQATSRRWRESEQGRAWRQSYGKSASRRYRHTEAGRAAVARARNRYNQKNKEKIATRQADYQRVHPEVVAAAIARRIARSRHAGGDSNGAQRKARADFYGGLCYLCGRSATAMDHVIPLAQGGSNWPANLRPICKSCNSTKSARWPYDIETHRQHQGYYGPGGSL